MKFKQPLVRLLLLGLVLTVLPVTARAAQDAFITVEEGEIRERPATDAKVIESLPRGTKVRVSNGAKDGWFKVRASTGQIGWITQESLNLALYKDELKSGQLAYRPQTPHEPRELEREPFLFFSAGALALPITMPNFSQAVGLNSSHYFIATGFYLDASVVVYDGIRLGLRYMSYSNTTSVSYFGNVYDITNEGHPFMVGLERELLTSEYWALDFGGFVGFSTNNRVTVTGTQLSTATLAAAPVGSNSNSFEVSQGQLAYLAIFYATYKPLKQFHVKLGAGFFYSRFTQTAIPSFTGQVPGGNQQLALQNVDALHAGPLVSLGLQFVY